MKSVKRYVFALVFVSGSAFAGSIEQCIIDEMPKIKAAEQARPTFRYCESKYDWYQGEPQSNSWFGYKDSWACITDLRRKVIGDSAKRYIVRACNALYVQERIK